MKGSLWKIVTVVTISSNKVVCVFTYISVEQQRDSYESLLEGSVLRAAGMSPVFQWDCEKLKQIPAVTQVGIKL